MALSMAAPPAQAEFATAPVVSPAEFATVATPQAAVASHPSSDQLAAQLGLSSDSPSIGAHEPAPSDYAD